MWCEIVYIGDAKFFLSLYLCYYYYPISFFLSPHLDVCVCVFPWNASLWTRSAQNSRIRIAKRLCTFFFYFSVPYFFFVLRNLLCAIASSYTYVFFFRSNKQSRSKILFFFTYTDTNALVSKHTYIHERYEAIVAINWVYVYIYTVCHLYWYVEQTARGFIYTSK